jgi:hypothetical protein
VLTINPSLFLINSSLEEAQEIEELKLLYGNDWPSIYKDILTKKRLEESLSSSSSSSSSNNTDTLNTKEVCNIQSKDNVCS